MIRKKLLYDKFEIESNIFFCLRNFGVSAITAYFMSHSMNFYRTTNLVIINQDLSYSYWLAYKQLLIFQKCIETSKDQNCSYYSH